MGYKRVSSNDGVVDIELTAVADAVYKELDVEEQNFSEEKSKGLYILNGLGEDAIPPNASFIQFSYLSEHEDPVLIEREVMPILQDGQDAVYWSIKSESNIFTHNADGSITPATNTWSFTKTIGSKEESFSGYYEVIGVKSNGETEIISTKTGVNTGAIAISKDYINYIVKLYESSLKETLFDSESYPLLEENSDAVRVDLSNDNVSMTSSESGEVSSTAFGGTGSILTVYLGVNELEFVKTSEAELNDGQWTLRSIESTNINFVDINNIIKQNNTAQVPNITSFDKTANYGFRRFIIVYKTFKGEVGTYTIDQTFSKAKQGEQGPQGVSGLTWNITPESITLYKDEDNKSFANNQTITISATQDSNTVNITSFKASVSSGSAIKLSYNNKTGGVLWTTEGDSPSVVLTVSTDANSSITNDTITIEVSSAKGNCTKKIPVIVMSTGRYLGMCSTCSSTTATSIKITSDANSTANLTTLSVGSGADNIHIGDWFLYVGTTGNGFVKSNRYKWNGVSWSIDTTDSHLMTAFGDSISLAENLPDNSEYSTIVKNLVASVIQVGKLFANKITLADNGKTGSDLRKGIIKSANWESGGGTLNADQTIKSYSNTGWALDYDGKADFTNANISGTIAAEVFHFSKLFTITDTNYTLPNGALKDFENGDMWLVQG